MVRRQAPGQRDLVYGRLGREHKLWIWKAERDDKTFDILESRSQLDVPSGRDLPLILESKSVVQKSSAGSWPAILPPSQEELELDAQFQLVRQSYTQLHGLPGNELSSTGPTESLELDSSGFLASSRENSMESSSAAEEYGSSNIEASTNPSSPNGSNMNTSNNNSQYTKSYMNDNSIHSHAYSDKFLEETFETKYSKQFMAESFEVDESGEMVFTNQNQGQEKEKKELTEQEKREQFQRLLASISEPKKLTFSMNPSNRKKFNPKDIRWDNRHHVSVSSKNKVLHNIHREFFDTPKGFDMCTKPLKILPREPITEKLMQTIDRDEVRIYPRSVLGSSSASSRPSPSRATSRQQSFPNTRPSSRQISTPNTPNNMAGQAPIRASSSRGGSRQMERKHSESYLQPYALSRKTSGNDLFVPASLKL